MKIKLIAILLTFSLPSFADSCDRIHNDRKVLAWAYEAMMAINNYNSTFNSKQMDKISADYLEKSAWKTYYQDHAKLYDEMKTNKLILSVGLFGTPVITEKGNNTWNVQVPLINIQQSPSSIKKERNLASLLIVKDKKYPDCLKIEKITIKKVVADNSKKDSSADPKTSPSKN